MAHDPHLEANLLSAWLEGGLGTADSLRVTAHLNRCQECRRIAACAGSILPAAAPSHRQTWLPSLALAASLVLVAGLSWPLSRPWLRTPVPALPAPRATVALPATSLTAAVTKVPSARTRPAIHKPRTAPLVARQVSAPAPLPVDALPDPSADVNRLNFSPASTGFADQPPRFGAQQTLTAWGGATQNLPLSAAPSLASRLSYAGDEPLDFSQASTGSEPHPWGMGWADAPAGSAPSLRVAGLSMRVETAVDSVLWAASRNDQVFTSTDHGAHWRTVVLPGAAAAPATVVSIRFQNPQEGSIRDRRGATWLTHDGGITWARR
ncbi:MAG TPA: zf-HC2 domain-containing protein [Terriglobales bacterium]|nr:zf-HC2 domain-containing protein [Terriglobales bacterium]